MRKQPIPRVLAAMSITAAMMTACGDGEVPAAESPVSSAIPSPCPAPPLEPGYLPAGAEPSDAQPIFGDPERLRTWTAGDGVVVQLGEGFLGDHGEEPRLERVEVRGRSANLLAHDDPSDGAPLVSVDWAEETRCGHKQYIVVTKRLSEEETLKIARSLEGDTT